MGGPEHHPRCLARLKSFLPARRTQAPAITRLQSGKTELRPRRRKVVAAGFGKFQEGIRHHRANGVAAGILVAGIAAAIAEKAGHGRGGTSLQRLVEHIARWARSWSEAPRFNRHVQST